MCFLNNPLLISELVMPKQMITDEFWPEFLAILTKLGVYAKANVRKVCEGILYYRRNSIAWRDLPEEYGRWFSVYRQFLRWSKSGLLIKVSPLKVQGATEAPARVVCIL